MYYNDIIILNLNSCLKNTNLISFEIINISFNKLSNGHKWIPL